ncbi:MAG: hypothetical protein ACKOTB_16150, partial [Planctomycetia bacterium]
MTPDEFFRQSADAASPVSFPADSYPQARPPRDAAAGGADLAAAIAAAREEAGRIVASRTEIGAAIETPAVRSVARAAPGVRRRGGGGLFGWGRRSTPDLVLEHGRLRVQVHEASGGILSVRRPNDRGNRLSQRLSIRTTRPPAAAGQAWEDATERAVHAAMQADGIERVPAAEGRGEAIESRGRLVSARGEALGTFTQRIELVEDAPLVFLDVTVRLARPAAGPFFEHYAACRFAWNRKRGRRRPSQSEHAVHRQRPGPVHGPLVHRAGRRRRTGRDGRRPRPGRDPHRRPPVARAFEPAHARHHPSHGDRRRHDGRAVGRRRRSRAAVGRGGRRRRGRCRRSTPPVSRTVGGTAASGARLPNTAAASP